MPPLDVHVSLNFKRSELACSHCLGYCMEADFVYALQRFRDKVDNPIKVVSGYRCRNHGIEQAKYKRNPGKDPGMHELGLAADITCPTVPVDELHRLAEEFGGFSGLGFNREGNTLHVDTRPLPARWAYRQGRVVDFHHV